MSTKNLSIDAFEKTISTNKHIYRRVNRRVFEWWGAWLEWFWDRGTSGGEGFGLKLPHLHHPPTRKLNDVISFLFLFPFFFFAVVDKRLVAFSFLIPTILSLFYKIFIKKKKNYEIGARIYLYILYFLFFHFSIPKLKYKKRKLKSIRSLSFPSPSHFSIPPLSIPNRMYPKRYN